MAFASGFVMDLQASSKKKTAVSRSWILLDHDGRGTILDVDKYAIMRMVEIHARDLRILDPLLSYPSTILGREKVIVLNLEAIMLNHKLFFFWVCFCSVTLLVFLWLFLGCSCSTSRLLSLRKRYVFVLGSV